MARYASQEAQKFHEGLDLYNGGEWFEAHEVWEDIWRDAEGERCRSIYTMRLRWS